jgi:glycosyltransferase involved in cell wall biosynthesis
MNIMTDWRGRTNARRIQIFVSDLSATGVVRNAIAIANEAAASGYQVRLLTCNADGVLRNELGPGVAVVRLNDPGDAHRPRRTQMKRALLAYRRHCRQWRPDIMLSAGNHGHLLSTFAWLGLPGMKVLRFSNDLTHGMPSRMTHLWRSARFRLIAWAADRLVYVSRAQARHRLLARQLAAGKALVIPNGVDLDLATRGAAQPCDHPWLNESSIPVVLAVGRHVPQKNFPALLQAFAMARATRPMRLIFLGDGKPTAMAALHALAAELGVERDVEFIPATGNPFPYMAAARTLVLPSLWEGSANVLLEAMACDTSVVASRTAGDAEDVLDNGRYGVLVDPRDIGQMAEALLCQTGPNSIRPRSRALAFSRSDTMRQYIRLFDQLGAQPIGQSVSRAAPVRA